MLLCYSDHQAHRAGMSPQQDRPLRHPSPSRSEELYSRLTQYFFSRIPVVKCVCRLRVRPIQGIKSIRQESPQPLLKQSVILRRRPVASPTRSFRSRAVEVCDVRAPKDLLRVRDLDSAASSSTSRSTGHHRSRQQQNRHQSQPFVHNGNSCPASR